MQFIIKNLRSLLILLMLPNLADAQSAYLSQSDKHSTFLERLEIKLQNDPLLNVTTAKPYSRKMVAEVAQTADSMFRNYEIDLSPVDRYNLHSLLMNNSEWVKGDKSSFESRRVFWNTFYRNKANFFEVNEKDFFLSVNPVLQLNLSNESGNAQKLFLNSRGISIRSMIAERIGVYTYLVENLERAPLFVQDRVNETRAIPGAGRFNKFKQTAWDYSDARGGITFNAAKYLDFQLAYDRNFIGNGYRSLFLSDFGSNYLFLKVNTRIWKLNYQNIFLELNPQFPKAVRDGDFLLDKKYAAMHHLSFNATKWLNVGLFEGVIFGRKNHFDFMYLNPVIFLRTAEKQNNSPDNGFVGFDFKANLLKRAQLYGQVMFDELLIRELRAGNGWWGNKFAIQAGAKFLDAFDIKNLDLQGEINMVRPFTYSHYDSSGSYGHYNQPLAHPFGANFVEAIGIIRFQPVPRLTTTARMIVWKQGIDTASTNYGSNIFKLYTTRTNEYGHKVAAGPSTKGINFQMHAAYELKENLYIDATMLLRRLRTNSDAYTQDRTNMLTVGLRWNMVRRDYNW